MTLKQPNCKIRRISNIGHSEVCFCRETRRNGVPWDFKVGSGKGFVKLSGSFLMWSAHKPLWLWWGHRTWGISCPEIVENTEGTWSIGHDHMSILRVRIGLDLLVLVRSSVVAKQTVNQRVWIGWYFQDLVANVPSCCLIRLIYESQSIQTWSSKLDFTFGHGFRMF